MDTRDRLQSIERAVCIIRCISMAEQGGVRLADITREVGLHKSTAHRILTTLIAEGWVHQNPASKRYTLGADLVAIGQTAVGKNALTAHARPILERIAQVTGDTVYLSVRAGFDAICLDLCEGDYPIKAASLSVGMRRPLGVGAGSLALLAFLPSTDISEIIDYNAARFSKFSSLDAESCMAAVSRACEKGYGQHDGHIIRGLSGIGVPVFDMHGLPIAAISLGAITDRLLSPRREELAAILKKEAHKLETCLAKTDTAIRDVKKG